MRKSYGKLHLFFIVVAAVEFNVAVMFSVVVGFAVRFLCAVVLSCDVLYCRVPTPSAFAFSCLGCNCNIVHRLIIR